MKSCAYCGAENKDEATYCSGCATTEFVVRAAGSESSKEEELQPMAEVAEPECDVPADGEATLCTVCLFPNLPEARWCKRCDAPMSALGMFLMPDAARANGFVYRRAVEARPKFVVVAWIWMHFFPGLLINALMLLGILVGNSGGWLGVASFLLTLLGGAICGSMLYRVTRNYYTMPKPQLDDVASQ